MSALNMETSKEVSIYVKITAEKQLLQHCIVYLRHINKERWISGQLTEDVYSRRGRESETAVVNTQKENLKK